MTVDVDRGVLPRVRPGLRGVRRAPPADGRGDRRLLRRRRLRARPRRRLPGRRPRRAVFSLPEVAIGIVPSSGGTYRLTRAVGPARARDLVLRGRRMGPDEALAWGLLTEVRRARRAPGSRGRAGRGAGRGCRPLRSRWPSSSSTAAPTSAATPRCCSSSSPTPRSTRSAPRRTRRPRRRGQRATRPRPARARIAASLDRARAQRQADRGGRADAALARLAVHHRPRRPRRPGPRRRGRRARTSRSRPRSSPRSTRSSTDPDAILASNTSSIPIMKLAHGHRPRPSRSSACTSSTRCRC